MLYDIAFLIFSIIYLPALLFKGKLHRDFLERFGIYSADALKILTSSDKKIWIEAVSVGEVALCKGFIPELQKKFPECKIILSTITKTGNDLAKKLYSDSVTVIYFPLDFSLIAAKAADVIRPKLFIMIETEIWPNILKALSDRGIPSILINGRISDRSFGKYRLAKPFLKNILKRIDRFSMQSQIDAERIKTLGAQAERVTVTGNMKFDTEIKSRPDSTLGLRESLGLKEGEELFVAGSTHRGEETIVIEAFKDLVKDFPRLKLLIAPRHIERAGEVEQVVRKFGFELIRTSALNSKLTTQNSKQVYILDTIGQLKDVYAIATVVFMGGSLVKHGGQNPIEPAVLEKAILFGPYMFNFKDIASIFLKNGAAIQVMNKKDLLERAKSLLKDSTMRIRLGQNAKRTVSENRGATERNLDAAVHLFVDDR